MNLNQAYQILDYQRVPEKREEQIGLIRVIGYTHLRGGGILSRCSDRQLLRVSERLFREAERMVQAELSAQVQEIREEEDVFLYHAFLCNSFNIPEPERELYTICKLEELLMQ